MKQASKAWKTKQKKVVAIRSLSVELNTRSLVLFLVFLLILADFASPHPPSSSHTKARGFLSLL